MTAKLLLSILVVLTACTPPDAPTNTPEASKFLGARASRIRAKPDPKQAAVREELLTTMSEPGRSQFASILDNPRYVGIEPQFTDEKRLAMWIHLRELQSSSNGSAEVTGLTIAAVPTLSAMGAKAQLLRRQGPHAHDILLLPAASANAEGITQAITATRKIRRVRGEHTAKNGVANITWPDTVLGFTEAARRHAGVLLAGLQSAPELAVPGIGKARALTIYLARSR